MFIRPFNAIIEENKKKVKEQQIKIIKKVIENKENFYQF